LTSLRFARFSPAMSPPLSHLVSAITAPASRLVAAANDTESFGPFTMSRDHWALFQRTVSISMTFIVALVLVRLIPWLERLVTRFANKHASPRDATASTIDAQQRVQTLTKVTSSIAQALIWTTTVIVVLGDVGIAVGPLLATAGIAGVAIGFGAQTIVKDFLSGFFILLENQFDVGDTITVNAVTGVVERMTLRITVLRDVMGTAYFFPNSNVVNVANRTYGWVRATLDAAFGPSVSARDARAAMESVMKRVEVDAELGKVIVEPGRIEGPVDFVGGAVTWRMTAKVRPGFSDEAKAALILALSDEMQSRGWKMTGNVIG
jgi:small-conductance mechanosensitive channel